MNFIEEKILEKGNLDKLKLRFPPEPNSGLHIGHAKSICLNFGLAEKLFRSFWRHKILELNLESVFSASLLCSWCITTHFMITISSTNFTSI